MADDRKMGDQPSDDQSDLNEFSGRLSKVRDAHRERHADVSGSTHGLALRVGSDFFAGIAVGGFLGWFIDRTFDTSPWGLFICVGLGFVIGTRLAIRSAQEINQRAQDDSQG